MNVPTSYNEATNCENAAEWLQAMDEEIETLEHNETFSRTELPKDKTAVGGKWVFAIKGNKESPVYKAPYVVRGFSQVEGIDFTGTFSPTARMESIRIPVQLAVQNGWLLEQMDVKGVYLHAPIECEVYVPAITKPRVGIEKVFVWTEAKWKTLALFLTSILEGSELSSIKC